MRAAAKTRARIRKAPGLEQPADQNRAYLSMNERSLVHTLARNDNHINALLRTPSVSRGEKTRNARRCRTGNDASGRWEEMYNCQCVCLVGVCPFAVAPARWRLIELV